MVIDPSFEGTAVGDTMRWAAERYGFRIDQHDGSVVDPDRIPDDFRGPSVVTLARQIADSGRGVDAAAAGRWAAQFPPTVASRTGDDPSSVLQQVKYLWRAVLALRLDAQPSTMQLHRPRS